MKTEHLWNSRALASQGWLLYKEPISNTWARPCAQGTGISSGRGPESSSQEASR